MFAASGQSVRLELTNSIPRSPPPLTLYTTGRKLSRGKIKKIFYKKSIDKSNKPCYTIITKRENKKGSKQNVRNSRIGCYFHLRYRFWIFGKCWYRLDTHMGIGKNWYYNYLWLDSCIFLASCDNFHSCVFNFKSNLFKERIKKKRIQSSFFL